jgi:hypothetical protein
MSRLYKTIHCSRSKVKPSRAAILLILGLLLRCVAGASLYAQSSSDQQSADAAKTQQLNDIEQRLKGLTDTLTQTQQALKQSLLEIQRLHAELDALRAKDSVGATAASTAPTPATSTAAPSQSVSSSLQTEVQALQEQQDILQAEIKQHEQTKVETELKYSLHVTGLLLFNAFSNAGVVDDADLPTFAFPRTPGVSHGSLGATLRQTVLGLSATGPMVGGAQSSAFVNVDFFGGVTSNSYGYAAPSGYVRMRDAQLGLDWNKTTLQVGYTEPLISPLSPTSYATVAQPSFTGAGNLWVWSPQIRLEQRIPLFTQSGLHLEAGLIDSPATNYYSTQLVSPVEASRRPGLEGRVSYHADSRATASSRSLVFGVGGYTANQEYGNTTNIHSWAVTGDWQMPLSHWIDLSGEVYRGRALGGLGGGVYKDMLTGTDPNTGLPLTIGVDTAGGWSQLKLIFNARMQANAVFGIDDAFSSNFRQVAIPVTATWPVSVARNSSVVGNFVYRPMSSLIFSPEYRRILTWKYNGGYPYVANIFTLSAGYRF